MPVDPRCFGLFFSNFWFWLNISTTSDRYWNHPNNDRNWADDWPAPETGEAHWSARNDGLRVGQPPEFLENGVRDDPDRSQWHHRGAKTEWAGHPRGHFHRPTSVGPPSGGSRGPDEMVRYEWSVQMLLRVEFFCNRSSNECHVYGQLYEKDWIPTKGELMLG